MRQVTPEELARRFHEVPLRNRAGEVVAHAIVDVEDAELVDRYRWSISNGYVAAWITGSGRIEYLEASCVV